MTGSQQRKIFAKFFVPQYFFDRNYILKDLFCANRFIYICSYRYRKDLERCRVSGSRAQPRELLAKKKSVTLNAAKSGNAATKATNDNSVASTEYQDNTEASTGNQHKDPGPRMSRIRDDSSRQATKGDLYEEAASAKRQDNSPKKKSVGSNQDEKKTKRAAKASSKATDSGVQLRRFSGRQVTARVILHQAFRSRRRSRRSR